MFVPSTLIRVASFSEIEASTETPSRASTICSPTAAVALLSSASINTGCRKLARRFAIPRLLEIPDLHAIAFELELGDIFLVDVGGTRTIYERRQPALENHVHGLFIRNKLRD